MVLFSCGFNPGISIPGFLLPPPEEVLFTFVLHFYQGSTDTFFLTLSEAVSVDAPYYLFVFKSRVTGTVINTVLTPSLSNARSDQFDVETDDVFDGAPLGQYTYIVYEQEDADNTDVTLTGSEIERGIAHLHKASPFAYTQAATTTQFIQP